MPRALKQELLSKSIRVVVLGSGGREHALAQKLLQSPLCRELVVLPGNDGMVAAGIKTAPTDLKDHTALIEQLRALGTEFVVVGPDDLLGAGVVDHLEEAGFVVFGPTKAAAKLEWSKAYAKEMMIAAGIPTARHLVLSSEDPDRLAEVAAELGGYPLVLKYDGLALGKGVQICLDRFEAESFAREVFQSEKFMKSAAKSKKSHPGLVVEQFLSGHEVSLFAVTDGTSFVVLEPACDHKRLLEGNAGPNTGGMGAYSPVPWLSADDLREMSAAVFPSLLAKMREAKTPFKGLLYAGLMVRGPEFWVLEFNARFGDPETQAILPRLESDLLPLLYGVGAGNLERHLDASPLRWTTQSCVNVVLVSGGYPEKPDTGHKISRLPQAQNSPGEFVFFSGVAEKEGALYNSGGRVLSVSSLGTSLDDARVRAVARAQDIQFEGKFFRKDIGSVRSNY